MLGLIELRICAAVTFLVTASEIAAGLARRRRPTHRARVVASRPPLRGTEVLWVGGTFAAVLWPLGAFLVPSIAYAWPALPTSPVLDAAQIAGAGIGIAGGGLFYRSSVALGVLLTPAIQLQEGHRLIDFGPYRWVRHPLYSAVLLIAFGQALLFLSVPALLLALVLLGLATYRAGLEEQLLRSPAAFGEAYEAYMARTGRFLPRLRAPP